MMREIQGQLHGVSNDYKMISIQVVDKLEFFYLQPRFVKQFRQYLYPGVFVSLTCENEKSKMRRRLVSKIITFEKIIGNRYHRKFSYFDQKKVKDEILTKISRYSYRLFLDLEMTMQQTRQNQVEIIQAGAILVNHKNELIWQFNSFIKPTIKTKISKRTLNFLGLKEEEIFSGVTYDAFYQAFKEIMDTYKPAVVVWGNNDKIALENSYHINTVKPLIKASDYINMQNVHKEYYNLNLELGLFNTAKVYGIHCGEQSHNAYIDAYVTREIFNHFHYYAKNDVDFDFKNILFQNNF